MDKAEWLAFELRVQQRKAAQAAERIASMEDGQTKQSDLLSAQGEALDALVLAVADVIGGGKE